MKKDFKLKFDQGSAVRIGWVDSASSHGWLDIEQISPEATMCETVGYFVFRSEHTTVVAQNRGFGKATAFGNYVSIPNCCIRKIEALV